MKEYRLKISGVHYAANPEAESHGLWMQGSCHDLSRETREARTQFIAQLEKAQNKEVRLLTEQLKQQRTSICGRMTLIERASQWWTERL